MKAQNVSIPLSIYLVLLTLPAGLGQERRQPEQERVRLVIGDWAANRREQLPSGRKRSLNCILKDSIPQPIMVGIGTPDSGNNISK